MVQRMTEGGGFDEAVIDGAAGWLGADWQP
jgi:hypothetical protein